MLAIALHVSHAFRNPQKLFLDTSMSLGNWWNSYNNRCANAHRSCRSQLHQQGFNRV